MKLMLRKSLWSLMLLLAVGVAAYTIHLLFWSTHVPPFLRERLASHAPSLYFHLLGGSAAIVLGALQMNMRLRKKFTAFHRWTGRVYLLAVLMSGTAGLEMSVVATGGWVAKSGFATMALLWLATGLLAYLAIRKGDIAAHRNWMMRNYSLTLAAITLRVYLGITFGLLQMDFMQVYPIISWACWVPNLLFAQWFFVNPIPRSSISNAVS
ncbi:putative membrane protein (DUF2306) [Solimicrobium silvestre]|uniref:Putative membrane protein (DUF2306) n=2 Tax=Solimicrobium silvestre TaxID=2099400 RepID=A0A2S9H2A6_9BURK|nr:putative membrane protein (DUF2306) [Solimicrobium silvestre]